MASDKKFDPKSLVQAGLSKSIEAQYPLAIGNVERLRRIHPDKSPAELVTFLNKSYLATVTATGAAAGAASIVPNGWVQVPAAIADVLTFLEASVFYTLSVAEVHGVDVEDLERRRLLVTSVLVGNAASTKALEPLFGRTVPYWGKKIVQSIPMTSIDAANKILGPRFITKYGTKQGIIVLAEQIPLFLGVGIGAGGNHLFGWFIIKSEKKILGPAPMSWDDLPRSGSIFASAPIPTPTTIHLEPS